MKRKLRGHFVTGCIPTAASNANRWADCRETGNVKTWYKGGQTQKEYHMDSFLSLVQANGIEGLVTGAVVLVFVYLLGQSGVAPSGNQKRVANVVLSILLSGLSLFEPQADGALVAAIASIGSALTYEFIRFLAAQAEKAKK